MKENQDPNLNQHSNLYLNQNNKQNYKQNYNFLCLNHNTAYRICISQKCQKSAFMCKQLSCNCQDNHDNCYSIKLKPFLTKLQAQRQYQMPKDIKKLYKQYITTIDLIIEQFSQLRTQIEEDMQFFGVSNQSKEFIKLTIKNDTLSINGKLLHLIQKHFHTSPKKIKSTQKKEQYLSLSSIKSKLSTILVQKRQKLIDNQLKVLSKKFKKINEIQPGQNDINLIARVIQIKKDQKGLRYQLTLGDQTGNVEGLFFDDQIFDNIAYGSQIAIIGGSANVKQQHIIMQLEDTGQIIKIGNFIQKINWSNCISKKHWILADQQSTIKNVS